MPTYGVEDASYNAAGQREGLAKLVEAFYRHMDTLPEAATIRAMHEDDLTVAHEKLTVFLCGWLGGPREYATKFGPIRIPRAHAHLKIDEPERDAWMLCMQRAVDEQDWADDFKRYFIEAIYVPAERSRAVSKARRDAE
jgi:hemoglobin